MPNYSDLNSIVFQAACNEAVETKVRPVRPRVLKRLAHKCKNDPQVAQLFSDTWVQADNDLGLPQPPWRERFVEKKFVEAIANDPRWKMVVLNAVVQERKWSDLWSRGYEVFADRVWSLFEKLISPEHLAARLSVGAGASLLAVLLAAKIQIGSTNLYEALLRPVLKPFQSKYVIPVEVKGTSAGEAELHVKLVLDDKELKASIRPAVKPTDLAVHLHPTVDAPVKFTPRIQYSVDDSGKANTNMGKPPGLSIRLLPTINMPLLPKDLWDSERGLKVSVTELNSKGGYSPTGGTSAGSDSAAAPAGGLVKETEGRGGPLDKIETDLNTLNVNLANLGNDFHASNSGTQANFASLQQSQNSIHSIAANHGRTTVVDAGPNSMRSVVLQWLGEDARSKFCTLTFQIADLSADRIELSVTRQECSPDTSLVEKLPYSISLSPSDPQQLGPWILSVDEIHRRWNFQHAAKLRFSWQPSAKDRAVTTQAKNTQP